MAKNKLMILDVQHPLGTLTDVLKWCEYLCDDYDITLLCFKGIEPVKIKGVKVVALRYFKSGIIRNMLFVFNALYYLSTFRGAVFIVYFRHCGMLRRLFGKLSFHLDIRSLSVDCDESVRIRENDFMKRECARFDSVSSLSSGVIKQLGRGDIKLLPIGADKISTVPKVYGKDLRLLYVGTFLGRHLEHTLEGMAIFRKRNPDAVVTYDIVGGGEPCDDAFIKRSIDDFGLHDSVVLHGPVPHGALAEYFDRANIGVSYIPITDYYDFQPPTKTYEYIRSGLYTIATATYENRKLIKSGTGTLIDDTPEGFAYGLECYMKERGHLSYDNISGSLDDSSWKVVIDRYMRPILDSFNR